MTNNHTAQTIDNLINMPEEQFRSIVDKEVRGTLDAATGEMLRHPRLVDRWYYALVSMKKSVESQLSSKRSDILKVPGPVNSRSSEWSDYHRWKAGAIRFKSGVEDRLLEIRRTHGRPTDRAAQLEQAILDHKSKVLADFAPDEVSDADTGLWHVVEE